MFQLIRPRGGVAVIAAVMVLVMSVTAVGAISLGRVVVAKREVQQAADVAAISVAEAVREGGRRANLTRAFAVGAANSRSPVTFTAERPRKSSTALTYSVESSTQIELPSFLFRQPKVTLRGRASARIEQFEVQRIDSLEPELVLVLDYSGSMRERMGTTDRITVLENAVRDMLDRNLNLSLAAVLFDTNVLAAQPFADDSPARIRELMDRPYPMLLTGTEKALARARELFEPVRSSGNAKFVLLVTDGYPTGPPSLVIAEARRMQEDPDLAVHVLTLHIDSKPHWRDVEFMVNLSGKAGALADPNSYFLATTAKALESLFEQLTARVACQVRSPRPIRSPATVRVFLEEPNGEDEVLLTNFGKELAAHPHELGYSVSGGRGGIELTTAACELMATGTRTLIVRHDRAVLSQ